MFKQDNQGISAAHPNQQITPDLGLCYVAMFFSDGAVRTFPPALRKLILLLTVLYVLVRRHC